MVLVRSSRSLGLSLVEAVRQQSIALFDPIKSKDDVFMVQRTTSYVLGEGSIDGSAFPPLSMSPALMASFVSPGSLSCLDLDDENDPSFSYPLFGDVVGPRPETCEIAPLYADR
jgi:hypothetical protein